MITILLILLILAMLGGLPQVGVCPPNYGYAPSGIAGTILIIILILVLIGRL